MTQALDTRDAAGTGSRSFFIPFPKSIPLSGQSPLMTLKALYRLGIEQGGDAISRALGHAEAMLLHNPGDRTALMYKGCLLTLVGEETLSPKKKVDYIRIGIRLMENALQGNGYAPATATELAAVRATALAILPDRFEQQTEALLSLSGLIEAPDFADQDSFDTTRILTLLACQSQARGDFHEAKIRFKQARTCDQDLAIKTYSDWITRQ